MDTDDIICALVRKTGRTVKDMELLKKEFILTVYNQELRLIHRGYGNGILQGLRMP